MNTKLMTRALPLLILTSLLLAMAPAAIAQNMPVTAAKVESAQSLCTTKYQGSMVGYWRFDNEADPMQPSEGALRGAVVGTTKTAAGIAGRSLEFDGQSYVDYGTGLNIPAWSQYTVSIWFKNDGRVAPAQGYGQKIIDKTTWYSDFYLAVQAEANPTHLYFQTYNNGPGYIMDNSHGYIDNKWHHAVIVRNGTIATLWVDGSNKGETTSAQIVDNNQPLLLGYSLSGDDFQRIFWGGYLDEFAVFNRALTQSEVTELYQKSLAGGSYCEGSSPVSGLGKFVDSGQRLGNFRSYDTELADLDGDGDLDAFVVNDAYGGADQTNEVWLNDGKGKFVDSGQRLYTSVNAFSLRVALGDLDNDGDIDAFVGTANYSKVWFNDGIGHFMRGEQTLWTTFANDVALGDVDSDGDLDAFVASPVSNNQLWLNDASGQFTLSSQTFADSKFALARLADLDGDSDLDILATQDATIDPEHVWLRVWLNDGTGKFSENIFKTSNATGARDISLGDLDNDGDIDAFFAVNCGGCPPIWLNDGTGKFSSTDQIFVGWVPLAVTLGDLDNDHDLDVVSGRGQRFDDVRNRIYLNDGNANFSDSEIILGNTTTKEVEVGDLDGDSDLDLFFANTGINEAWGEPNEVWFQIHAPNCSLATSSIRTILPADKQFVDINIGNITDLDGDPVTTSIERILQDEPVDSTGDGSYVPDATGIGTATARLRAERIDGGNGRVYEIGFTANDGNGGTCSGTVNVEVPSAEGVAAINDGTIYESTQSATSITIRKNALPDSPRNFRYWSAFGNFQLDDPGTDDGDGINNSAYFKVKPGVYSFSEEKAANWFLTAIDCGSYTGATINLADRSVKLDVKQGATANCVFENKYAASLTVSSYWDMDQNGQRGATEDGLNGWWTEFYDSGGKLKTSNFTQNGGSWSLYNIRPGTYTVCQKPQAGQYNTQPAQLDPAHNNWPCYNFELTYAQEAKLYFGYSKQPLAANANLALAAANASVEIAPVADSEQDRFYTWDEFLAEHPGDRLPDEEEAKGTLYLPMITR